MVKCYQSVTACIGLSYIRMYYASALHAKAVVVMFSDIALGGTFETFTLYLSSIDVPYSIQC